MKMPARAIAGMCRCVGRVGVSVTRRLCRGERRITLALIRPTNLAQLFFASGQALFSSGRKASSAGMVAMSL